MKTNGIFQKFQSDEGDISPEDEPIINGGNTNTWVTGHEGGEQTVTDLQPLRHESDSFFDFDCELESPGSPADECEYLRLIESTSNTPHNSTAESGYACASVASSHSSSDGPYFDVNSENESTNIQQLQHNHTCHSHQPDPDEVDCVKVVAKTTENGLHPVQCNGYPNHNDSMTPANESQLKSNDLKQTLPSEGPDIEITLAEKSQNQNSAIANGMAKSVQEQILQELHKQSQEYKEEHDKNLKIVEPQIAEISVEKECPQQDLHQVITLINGHAENGEDVLQIEVVQDVKETDVKHKAEEEMESLIKSKETVENNEVKSTADTVAPNANDSPKKSTHLHMDTTDDEDDCRPQRVRRCSSLKTGKTPPGTPGRKKIVRFADVLGLDLADIKTFLDEVPTIPKSAYEDLEILENEPPVQLGPKSNRLLMPLFQQPGGLPKFLDIVREKLVSLENAAVTDTINHTITGSVRVRNLDFHKSVHIRYSLDGWRSYADLQANYVENSCDGFSDTFSFVMFGNSLHIGQRLEFAVRFQCKGQQYWDNNYGSNYCFQCLPTSAPATLPAISVLPSHHNSNLVGVLSPTVGESWCTSFY